MYYFIVNPGSRTGHGRELWKNLEKRLKRAGIEFKVYFTEGEGDATRIAKEICTEHPEMKRVVIAGGDGTANEAVNGLSNYNKLILGYIPTGSSNDLARGLGIPLEPEAALERVIHPRKFARVDHGIMEPVGGGEPRKFAVSSGIGYDADICYEALSSPLKTFLNKIHLGKLIYFILGLKLIFTNKPAAATVILDGKRKITYKKLVFAASMNTLYEGGGMPMGPGADPSDGKVTVCILHDLSKLKHLALMPTVIKGKHIRHREVDLFTCSSFEVIADRPLVVHTDGEFAGKFDHIRVSCLPDKVRMML